VNSRNQSAAAVNPNAGKALEAYLRAIHEQALAAARQEYFTEYRALITAGRADLLDDLSARFRNIAVDILTGTPLDEPCLF
jgi:hypothetical protein